MRRMVASGVAALAAIALWTQAHAGPAYTIPSACTFTAADGGVARSCSGRFADRVSVKDFGAAGDSSTDDGPAFQKAHDALGPDGGEIWVPAISGYYKIATTVAFTKPVRLIGAGWYSSEILSTTASLTWFTSTNQIQVENMGFTGSGACVNTCVFIKQLSTSGGHNGSLFRNNYFSGANKVYWAQRATEFSFVLNKCNNGAYCLYLENLTSSDEGDSLVNTNNFANSTSAIFIATTSGLYISNNKFNGSAGCHIDIANTTNPVGNYVIIGNSLEGFSTCGVREIGTTGANTKTLITGNQFSGGSATHVIVGNKTQNVTITGNVFNDTNAANGIGVDIQTGAKNVTITGNAFHQIQTAMQASSTLIGTDVNGNRFADDVTTYWTGEDSTNGISGFGGAKSLESSRYVTTTSDVTYTDVFKVKGDCTVEIEVSGVVQGVGNSYKFRKVAVSNGSTVTDITAVVTVGAAFDLQVAASGGYAVFSAKRAAATGTSITMMMTVRVRGYPTGFLKV